MNINRHNYESFFLLYTDNELDAAERMAVEAFVQQNPDLQEELELLQQTVLRPESQVSFAGKAMLMRDGDQAVQIHAGNCETYFVLYADDELTNDEKRAVEAFVYHHPQYQEALELVQVVRMEPDTTITYENKQELYRKEEKDKVIPFPWWRIAAAAMVLLFLGLWWLGRDKQEVVIPVANIIKHPAPGVKTTTTPPAVISTIAGANETTEKKSDRQPVKNNNIRKEQKTDNNNNVAVTTNDAKQPVNKQPETNNLPQLAVVEPPANDTKNNTSVLPDQPRNAIDIKSVANGVKHVLSNGMARLNQTAEAAPAVEYVSYDNSNKDQIEVMNTSVNKKNALRGLLRKASRIIAKKTGTGDDDDDDQKHILVGSFAIAVK